MKAASRQAWATTSMQCTRMLVVAQLLVACAATPSNTAPHNDALEGARQVVIVISDDWNASRGVLRTFERDSGGWRATGFSTAVALGRNGSGWGIGLHPAQEIGPVKREGDGRAPAGVFVLGGAFGYASSASTSMSYLPMQASHYCIDVPTSPLYNRIVDANDVGVTAVEGSTEPMRLDLHADGDVRYRLGFVIGHNERARVGGGSCIFAHLWRKAGEATAGCTAMDDAAMQSLLDWLQPARQPLFVLLPAAEYARRQRAWQLPVLEQTAP